MRRRLRKKIILWFMAILAVGVLIGEQPLFADRPEVIDPFVDPGSLVFITIIDTDPNCVFGQDHLIIAGVRFDSDSSPDADSVIQVIRNCDGFIRFNFKPVGRPE